ncbi:NAD(P)/FAD-dependent oxidoreductase [Crocosphaera sp. XPORK-15E]|uniref:NAD(P)/FAD-dependent oxidoreductase n=1 Tax=Crocosphaera sp. XPORK-15E TaxID=3110247 RepID=UPI003A4D20BD
MNQLLTVIVIGGGAAGFFAAITCANTYPNTQVILLEAGRQPLAKVRISGGGRCNVTHHCFDPVQLINYYPRGSKALRGAFTRFQPRDTVAWFESQGVKLKTESDGRMFPITDNSETIVNCLINTALNAGVKLRTQTPVKSVKKVDNGFEIELKTGEILSGDRLLIATGSNPLGYRWAKDLGHTIERPIPSLFTFNINDPRLQGLAGVSVENAAVRLLNSGKKPLQQIGPVLITHWGLSGPAILKLSAFGARILHDNSYQMSLSINWVYPQNTEEIKQILLESKSQFTRKLITNLCPFEIPKRLWQKIINYLNINESKKWAELSQKEINQLTQELAQGQYKIKGKGVFKEEFVTCGGINLKEIDFKTMESKPCPNLYFAGEILDIDGVTGGFNFQSAWTTSWLAGKAIGKH